MERISPPASGLTGAFDQTYLNALKTVGYLVQSSLSPVKSLFGYRSQAMLLAKEDTQFLTLTTTFATMEQWSPTTPRKQYHTNGLYFSLPTIDWFLVGLAPGGRNLRTSLWVHYFSMWTNLNDLTLPFHQKNDPRIIFGESTGTFSLRHT